MAAPAASPYVDRVDTFAPSILWAGFAALVLVLLVVDLALHRRTPATMRAAVGWTLAWIAAGVAFGGALWAWQGSEIALQYFAGYVVEKSLSVDNVFAFLVLLSTFAVPLEHRHRVLFFGVVGAIVLRFLLILAGAEVLEHFHLAVVPLGAFLALLGVKLWRERGSAEPGGPPRLVRALTRAIPATHEPRGDKLFVRESGKLLATPLFVALVAIEITDVVFAVDSVPAVFAVTEDPFVVFASNVFALLGLRSLTFVIADLLPRLPYLKTGLALILVFVGVKLAIEPWLAVPVGASLAAIGAILGAAVAASLVKNARQRRRSTASQPAQSQS